MTDAGGIKNVASTSAEYEASARAWHLPRTLMGGTSAMRAAKTRYLPREPGESDPAYENRLNRSTLFNAYRKTVKDMAGKVFAKPIVLEDDVPPALKDYAENIDLSGRNLSVFAYELFVDGLQAGVTFVLADMPPKPRKRRWTRADDKQSGRRPYLVHRAAESIIGWKSSIIDGYETLTQVRIREYASEPDPGNPFEDLCIEQIRVLEPGKWMIYRKDPKDPKNWVLHNEGVTTLSYIPLVPVYFNRTGFMTGAPPLEDLADLNVAHWQSQSDQRHILHVARVPFLFGAGFDPPPEGKPEVVIGPNSMMRATNPQASLEYVEHSGAAIGSGRDDLKDIEFQMQAMGLQLLIPKPQQTATGEISDDVKENSPLAMMAQALEDSLETAFGFMAEYDGVAKAGDDPGGSLVVNKEFGMTTRGATDIADLITMASSGLITPATFVREAQRRGVISEDIKPDDEVAAAEALAQARAKFAAETAAAARPKPTAVAA